MSQLHHLVWELPNHSLGMTVGAKVPADSKPAFGSRKVLPSQLDPLLRLLLRTFPPYELDKFFRVGLGYDRKDRAIITMQPGQSITDEMTLSGNPAPGPASHDLRRTGRAVGGSRVETHFLDKPQYRGKSTALPRHARSADDRLAREKAARMRLAAKTSAQLTDAFPRGTKTLMLQLVRAYQTAFLAETEASAVTVCHDLYQATSKLNVDQGRTMILTWRAVAPLSTSTVDETFNFADVAPPGGADFQAEWDSQSPTDDLTRAARVALRQRALRRTVTRQRSTEPSDLPAWLRGEGPGPPDADGDDPHKPRTALQRFVRYIFSVRLADCRRDNDGKPLGDGTWFRPRDPTEDESKKLAKYRGQDYSRPRATPLDCATRHRRSATSMSTSGTGSKVGPQRHAARTCCASSS